ncbi:MAG: glycosyl hydrolase family 79 C-terminal domain-containing protein [Solirubrobacteraceae bacterium]
MRKRYSRHLCGAILVVLSLIAGIVVAWLASATPSSSFAATIALRAPAGTPVLSVGRELPVAPIASGFVGLSVEYDALAIYMGSGGLDPVFIQLVRNLNPRQAPVLRIGGDSTDFAWVPVPGMQPPPGLLYALTPGWLRAFGALVRALHARVILGIDLEADSPVIAQAEARALVSAVGRSSVEALEVGNEPELYPAATWWFTPSGIGVKGRPPNYDVASYIADYQRWAQVLPRLPLAAPASGSLSWIGKLRPIVVAAARLGLVTVHRYPLEACFAVPGSPTYPTAARLLARSSSAGLAASVAQAVAVAHARGVPLRVDELNSISCRGVSGVSNAFASALWVLDSLFSMARVGVNGVNVHTLFTADYHPFNVTRVRGRRVWTVDPMYYGMLMFTQAAPPQSRLLAISGSAGRRVRAWATRARGGRVHVVLINDNTRGSLYVSLRIEGASGPGALSRLIAPSIDATGHVSIGGRSFGARTATGLLVGKPRVFAVLPVAGAYVLRLPPASAALLAVQPAR